MSGSVTGVQEAGISNHAHDVTGLQTAGKVGFTVMPSVYYANIARGLEGNLTQISPIQPVAQTTRGRFGVGIAVGISLLN